MTARFSEMLAALTIASHYTGRYTQVSSKSAQKANRMHL